MSNFGKLKFIYAVIFLLYSYQNILLYSYQNIVESQCQNDCTLALASYYVVSGSTLPLIANYFNGNSTLMDDIISYNPNEVENEDVLFPNIRISVPFSCGCVNNNNNDSFLGHVFSYQFQVGDTYDKIARNNFSDLTTMDFIEKFNPYSRFNVPDFAFINVPVNCSCGNSSVSKAYGLFITYPLRSGESLRSISQQFNLSESLLQAYNPGVDFSAGTGLVYIPGKDKNGTYPPFRSASAGSGLSGGTIAGICIAAVAVIVVLTGFYLRYRSKEMKGASLLCEKPGYQFTPSNSANQSGDTLGRGSSGSAGQGSSGINVGNSVEYSFEELAKATDDFNTNNKIGSGGFGEVYLGELRGVKAAIKKMGMQASKEFLAELKVLTRVHHMHLVRLLGYCVEDSLFVVYEYIDNGNLRQHLRSTERDPLPWSTRLKIAFDSAKGLEYIHEHTDPVYIHRDIKPENILLTNKFQAKVADFGLAKLAEVGNASLPSRLIGTFGYMPPEYALLGEVTSKVDIFAFGVVLYELISAKGPIVRDSELVGDEPRGLVALFEDVMDLPDANEIRKLIDPRLGDDYPLEAVRQVAELAKACTHDIPQLRPSMRSVAVALMTLSSTTESWDNNDTLYRNNEILQPVSGR